jgi:predicted transcriptional regulator
VERTTSRLSVQSNLLLRVLLSAGGDWLTRSSIARRLRKRRLSAYDIAMLEILQEKGLVEIQHRENRTPIGYEFVYSVTERAAAEDSIEPR